MELSLQLCRGARNGSINALHRTQSSIAVSDDGHKWVVINASPDIRQQINARPQLANAAGARGSAIAGVVVTDAQIDHTTGLLILREGLPMNLYCTDVVRHQLTHEFPLLNILTHWDGGFRVHSISVEPEKAFQVEGVPNLRFDPVVLVSKAPPYSAHRHDPHVGDNIGLKVTDCRTGEYLFYAPGLAEPDDSVREAMSGAACVMVDGTLWQDDEMIQNGFSDSLGTDMGHLSVSGSKGMLALLSQFDRPRKVLIHINNTNPILDEDSKERRKVNDAGVDVAFDGMEIEF